MWSPLLQKIRRRPNMLFNFLGFLMTKQLIRDISVEMTNYSNEDDHPALDWPSFEGPIKDAAFELGKLLQAPSMKKHNLEGRNKLDRGRRK